MNLVMNPDGSEVRQVTEPPHGWRDNVPAWSPDGQLITFERVKADESTDQTWFVDPDTVDTRTVVPGTGERCVYAMDPYFSPDGHSIAYGRTVAPPNSNHTLKWRGRRICHFLNKARVVVTFPPADGDPRLLHVPRAAGAMRGYLSVWSFRVVPWQPPCQLSLSMGFGHDAYVIDLIGLRLAGSASESRAVAATHSSRQIRILRRNRTSRSEGRALTNATQTGRQRQQRRCLRAPPSAAAGLYEPKFDGYWSRVFVGDKRARAVPTPVRHHRRSATSQTQPLISCPAGAVSDCEPLSGTTATLTSQCCSDVWREGVADCWPTRPT
jgi:hypothetical protein